MLIESITKEVAKSGMSISKEKLLDTIVTRHCGEVRTAAQALRFFRISGQATTSESEG